MTLRSLNLLAGAAASVVLISATVATASPLMPDPNRRSTPSITLTASPILDVQPQFIPDPAVVFSAIDGPYAAFAARSGSLGFDDYDSTAVGQSSDMGLTSLRFVGGVTEVNDIIFFDFFTDDQVFVDGFGVAFPQAGNFIWTITVGDGTDFVIPTQGLHQLTAPADQGTNGSSTGQWFLSTTPPTVGTQDPNIGSIVTHSHRFELTAVVPEPTTAGLLGVAGLGLLTRRRRA